MIELLYKIQFERKESRWSCEWDLDAVCRGISFRSCEDWCYYTILKTVGRVTPNELLRRIVGTLCSGGYETDPLGRYQFSKL